jgi:hypothetical protein
MRAQGWYHDPYASHDDRWFSDGSPTSLVRDAGVESRDEPPGTPPPLPLVPVSDSPGADASDMRRADDKTRVDQSFDPKEGARIALDRSGELGIGFH